MYDEPEKWEIFCEVEKSIARKSSFFSTGIFFVSSTSCLEARNSFKQCGKYPLRRQKRNEGKIFITEKMKTFAMFTKFSISVPKQSLGTPYVGLLAADVIWGTTQETLTET